MTTSESVAATRGLPAILLGYTPNDKGYWYEPELPNLTALDDPERRQDALATYTILRVQGNAMAPRFKDGTYVAALPVTRRQDLVPGIYLYEWTYADGSTYRVFARLERVASGWLVLRRDKTDDLIRCRLQWHHPSFHLHRVTHYVRYEIT